MPPWTILTRAIVCAGAGIILACQPAIATEKTRSAPAAKHAKGPCILEFGSRHTVVRVEDSETLVLDDGRIVRLIGTLAPKPPLTAASTDVWKPEQDAHAALRTLVEGVDVSLAFHGRRKDRYGRLLAHVFAWHDGRRYWVQGEMLANGHARAYALPGSTGCTAELLAHETRARDSSRGLWRQRRYRVLKPKPEGYLMRRRHSFQIVHGRVADVAVVKGMIYLNFGTDWRHDFTAAIRRKALVGTNTTADILVALKGRNVRVRGWIERNNGPFIKLPHPDLIELDEPEQRQRNHETDELPEMANTPEDTMTVRRAPQRLPIPRIKRRPATKRSPDALKL